MRARRDRDTCGPGSSMHAASHFAFATSCIFRDKLYISRQVCIFHDKFVYFATSCIFHDKLYISKQVVYFATSCILISGQVVYFATSCIFRDKLYISKQVVYFATSCIFQNKLYISRQVIYLATSCIFIFNFVDTPRNFIIAKLSIRKPGSSSVLIKS